MLSEQAAVMSALGAPRYSILVRFGMDTPVRAWAGVGDLEIPADDLEDEAATYQGVGVLGEVPALRQLIGGTAERLEFQLSVPGSSYVDIHGQNQTLDVFALADEDAGEVMNSPVDVGVIFFGTGWQQSDVAWLWNGTADVPSVSRSGSGLNVTRSISISVASAFTDRTRPQLTYFTDADQKRRSPTDTFCARVILYTVNSTVKWPN